MIRKITVEYKPEKDDREMRDYVITIQHETTIQIIRLNSAEFINLQSAMDLLTY